MLGLLAVASLVAVPQPAAQPARLAPAGKWTVEFADRSCNASRVFATGERQLLIVFDPRPGADNSLGFRLAVPASELKRWSNSSLTVTGSTGPSTPHFPEGRLSDGRILIVGYLRDSDKTAVEQGATLIFTNAGGRDELVMTGYRTAATALDRCLDDLVTTWGYAPGFFKSLTSPAKAIRNVASFVRDGDYPTDALRRSAQGQVEVRLTIAPSGKPSDCVVLRSSSHADLDNATCVAGLRGRFTPAIDKDGKAVTAPFVANIRWIIPSD